MSADNQGNKENKIDVYERKAVFTRLKEFCYFAGEHDFIEVCEWKNGEGFDVELNGKHIERFQLTFGEFKALKKLIKEIDK
jgi:hypothetical protein